MWKNRLLWLSGIVLAGTVYFFDNHGGTLLLLAGVILVPLLALLPCLFGRKMLEFDLELPQAGEKGQGLQGILRAKTRFFYPLRVHAELVCRNLRTGEEQRLPVEWSLFRKGELPICLHCDHCGKLRLNLENSGIFDPFALFSLSVPSHVTGELTILPDLFPIDLTLGDSSSSNPDSDDYAPDRPGNDPGETHAIREYTPGDAIRQMHWKLSEKTDRAMVREYGLPVVNDILVLVDTAKGEPALVDSVTEVAASILQALEGRNYHLGWRNRIFDLRPVTEPGAFPYLLEELLALPCGEGSVCADFLEENHHCGFSHVIVIGTQIPTGTADLYNGNRVTVLIPGTDEGIMGDGTVLRSFDPARPGEALAVLEV